MTFGYLSALDRMLAAGVGELSREFTARQSAFITRMHQPGGGFRGRLGGPDLYYTDFGVRVLALLSPDCEAAHASVIWVAQQQSTPRNIIECFGVMNIERVLGDCGHDLSVSRDHLFPLILSQMLPSGGFARPGGSEVSAYNTFLAALCFDMVQEAIPHPESAVAAIERLRCTDGGYRETLGQASSQTNATTAAVAYLTMQDAISTEHAESAAGFLARMQAPSGGLLAQPCAPEADLLSTFTGVVTLFGLNALERLDLPSIARFVGRLACRDGGFRACLSDDEPDTEYTYYGLGTLALLRVYVMASEDI